MSRQAAMAAASARVSGLRAIEPGRWGYHLWSNAEDAWIPPLRTDRYADACRKRAGSIAAIAAFELLRNGSAVFNEQLALRIMQLAYGATTGSARQRLDQILDAL